MSVSAFTDNLQGSETVLVVEDEPFVRLFLKEVLLTYGYHPVEASTGEEAIIAYGHLKKPVDLVIADVILPSMSGPHLVSLLNSAGGRFKVLYTSGHTEERLKREDGLGNEVNFLQKPFTTTALLTKLREILD